MGFENPSGNSSRTTQENSDTTFETDRPMKKARFAWQVKGKYHLKTKDPPLTNNALSEIAESKQLTENVDVLAAGTSKDALRKNVNCVDVEISKSEKQEFTECPLTENTLAQIGPCNSLYRNKQLKLTKAACKDIIHLNNKFCVDRKVKIPVPVSMVKRKSRKDAMLAKWQAKQIATAFVDNTINGVLDSWVAAPLSSSGRSENDAGFHAEEFLDILPRRSSVENEGILMAISQHGLRNNCAEAASTWLENKSGASTSFCEAESLTSPSSISLPLHPVLKATSAFDNCPSIYLSKYKDIIHQEKGCSDTKKTCGILKNAKDALCSNSEQAEPKAWRNLAEPCVCPHSVRTGFAVHEVKPGIPFHKRVRTVEEPDSSTNFETNSHYLKTADQNLSPWFSKKLVTKTVDNEKNTDYGNEFGDVDFMDAALACAIQNKGLNSFGLD